MSTEKGNTSAIQKFKTKKEWQEQEFQKTYDELQVILGRCDELENQIGELPEGAHPDERKPRAETWLKERENWQNEVQRLRAYITKLEQRVLPLKN